MTTQQTITSTEFDLLSGLIFIVNWQTDRIQFVNTAVENKFAIPRRSFIDQSFSALFIESANLLKSFVLTGESHFSQVSQHAQMKPSFGMQEPLDVFLSISKWPMDPQLVLIELRVDNNRVKSEREYRTMEMALIHKELIRHLAHEIKNPLGAIKGAAQLMAHDLIQKPELIEYTDVIIQETIRLQQLVDRLLEPHRFANQISLINIHEVLDRVIRIILAEYPTGLKIVRDYDVSIPEFNADRNKLIQAILNVMQNAAQALEQAIESSTAQIKVVTRIARQISLAQKQYKLALDLRIIDNGPGIPADLIERVFYPLFSGRKGGAGVGLTLTQTFIHQHDGWIECTSKPPQTEFRILLPIH